MPIAKHDSFNRFVVEDLIQRSKISILLQIPLLFIYVRAFFDSQSDNIFVWFFSGMVVVFALIRFHLIFKTVESHKKFLDQLFAIVMIQAVNWSAVIFNVMNDPQENSDAHSVSIMIGVGLVTSANYSFSASKRIRIGYITAIFSAFFIYYSLNIESASLNEWKWILILGVFYTFLLSQGYLQYRDWSNMLSTKLHLQGIFDHFPGIINLVRDDKYLMVSSGIEKFFELSPVSLLNQKVGALHSDSFFVQSYFKFKNSDDVSTLSEGELSTKLGTRSFLIMFQRLPTSADILIISLDIHNLKSAEKEILKQRAQLESASKMAALGQMSSGLAHEINNPLTAIMARTSMIRHLISENSEKNHKRIVDSVGAIEKTVDRISLIIKGLRTFAREGAQLPFATVKLDDVINETLSFCRTRMNQESVTFEYANSDVDAMVYCQSTQLSQVILNVLNNSLDAIMDLPNKWIRMEVGHRNNLIQIKIVDSGLGIPEHIRNKLMDPFFTTKEVGKGTGLGLSISKGIIENQNGSIYFTHEALNTTMIIELPLPSVSVKVAA